MRGARERGAVRVREERAQGRERRGSVVFLFFFVLALFHCFDLAFNLFFSSREKERENHGSLLGQAPRALRSPGSDRRRRGIGLRVRARGVRAPVLRRQV